MTEYTLPQLSVEQTAVIKAIGEGYNVKVSGVAGCGKTTTILGICSEHRDKKFLVLTYNARLKTETREKAERLDLKNTEVHSYHAMCVRYYTSKGAKDIGIVETVRDDLTLRRSLDFDVIILDECQDMTKCYFSFVRKIVQDNTTSKVQYCIFGDEKQNIFDFKGADERFLTHGPLIFKEPSARQWKELNVHTSFRVTNEIASFINTYLIGYNKIKACKHGSRVRYMYVNYFKQMTQIYKEVIYYLDKGFSYDDIFILAPSIKKNAGVSPIVKLENLLVKNGHQCFAPVSDDAKIDEEIIKGKIVFSSFHQVKGLERPVVIVFNFDYSYFKYFARDLQTDRCPNIIYVATTRAVQNLTVIHGCDNQPLLPSITYDRITQDPNVTIVGGLMAKDVFSEKNPKTQDKIPIKVTDILRFLDTEVIENAIKMIEYTIHKSDAGEGQKHINLPQKAVCTKKKTAEIVYDINGYAIPAFFEMSYFNTCSLLDSIDYDDLDDSQKRNYNKISYKFGEEKTLPVNYLLYISTLYDATINGYKHRTKQIANYDWISQEDLSNCCNVLKTNVGTVKSPNGICFEKAYKNCQFLTTKYMLQGTIDVINRETGTLWEIKCTSSSDSEHIIQLAIYAWMTRMKDNIQYKYKLLNVCTNEIVTLLYNNEKVTSMIEYLLKCKYEKRKILSDNEFIQDCQL